MKPRIIFIHGNQTKSWQFVWTPWLKKELEKAGYETDFQLFPDSIIARAKYWLPFLQNHIKAGENDVLVGWSSGAVAAMRYPETHKIKGSVLVAPSYTDLNDELEKQSGYFDTPWNWGAIKKNQEHIALFYSDNDEFIPVTEFEHIVQELSPEVHKFSGNGHFMNQETFSELLQYIVEIYP